MNYLKKFRVERGLTQHQLAEEIGISDCFISLLEAGKKRPGIKTAKKIGKVLGCDWYTLFEDKPNNDTG